MLDSACERDRVGSGGVVCDCDIDWAAMLHTGQRQRAGNLGIWDACWAAIRCRETGGRDATAVKVTDGLSFPSVTC